jgi:membrane protein
MSTPCFDKSEPAPRAAGVSAWGWIRKQFWDRPREVWDRFQRDDGSLMAAATSFYAGLSLMPLLIVMVSGLGVFLQTTQLGVNAQMHVLEAIEAEGSPLIRNQAEALLDDTAKGAGVSGPLGLVGLLLGAMAIFAQFERAFDRIWNIETHRPKGFLRALRYILLERFRAFLMLGSLGLLVIVLFLAGMTLTTIEQFASRWWPIPAALSNLLQWGVSLALNTILFTLLYRLMPKVKVLWREALLGGFLVAIGWELGRHGLSAFLMRSQYLSAYGTIGSLLAILIWIYYSAHLIFLGAEYIQVICKRCDPDSQTP